jgi:GTP-binding protein Era
MEIMDSNYKSGFVAVMGRPNVGKSTLINALLGQKIAAVSPRPQTTRKRQMGILTLNEAEHGQNAQMVFVDTPGFHQPVHKLGELMNQEAIDTLEESDAILFVVDASAPPHEEDLLLAKQLGGLRRMAPLVLALNKIDEIDPIGLEEHRRLFLEIAPQAQALEICATQGINLGALLDALLERLPLGPPFFPAEQLTDLYEREIAADLIREAGLKLLRDEVPHGIAIRIDQYKERNEHGAYIEATLFVERESHKPIVIGAKGAMLKKIGTLARQEIEAMSGRKVYLRIRVKVRKNWRDDDNVLRRFGY